MKSNKFLLAIAAMAAVSMSSCSQEEELVVPDNQLSENAVVFGTYIGASRATEINTAALQASQDGFGVLAYYTGQNAFDNTSKPNFMYNQQVTYSANAWTYTPLKYWPNNSGDNISFFAYAPYTGTFGTTNIAGLSANTIAGEPTLDFVVAEDVNSQVDLLYADAVKDKTKPGVAETVSFNFKHALSRLSFSRQLVVDNDKELDAKTTVTINSVTFSAMSFGTEGTLNLSTGDWNVTKSDDMEYEISTTKNNIQNNVIAGGENSTDEADLTAANGNIMFIPVDMTATGSTASGKITVNYTVETTDTNLPNNASTITNNIEVEVPAIKFLPGYAYKFVLKISLTSVKLDVIKVADWVDGTITDWESKTF